VKALDEAMDALLSAEAGGDEDDDDADSDEDADIFGIAAGDADEDEDENEEEEETTTRQKNKKVCVYLCHSVPVSASVCLCVGGLFETERLGCRYEHIERTMVIWCVVRAHLCMRP
jgi:hypothetical protein